MGHPAPKHKTTDQVGLGDIASLLGVAPKTAYQWKWRGLLPPPALTISGRPLWTRAAIVAWAEQSGRTLAPEPDP